MGRSSGCVPKPAASERPKSCSPTPPPGRPDRWSKSNCHPRGASPGPLTITATDCTLALRDGQPLLLFDGEIQPERMLASVQWQGQGSLVTPATPMVGWRMAAGAIEPLEDEALSVAGLVRGDVQFAGEALARPADSRAARWQAPLQSDDPPGIGDGLPE